MKNLSFLKVTLEIPMAKLLKSYLKVTLDIPMVTVVIPQGNIGNTTRKH
jgi:hypothetical protein